MFVIVHEMVCAYTLLHLIPYNSNQKHYVQNISIQKEELELDYSV